MKRLFFFVALLWLSFFIFPHSSFATGAADQGWCSPDPNQSSGNELCNFGSAESACEYLVSAEYPNGNYEFTDAEYKNSTSRALCNMKKVNNNGLYKGHGSVYKRCAANHKRVGNTCLKIFISRHDYQCPLTGGTGDTGISNPINIINGAKYQSFVDFSTADGFLKVARYYNSLPYGHADETFGYADGNYFNLTRLGMNWALSSHPVLHIAEDYIDHDKRMALYTPKGSATYFSGTDATASVEILGGGQSEYRASVVELSGTNEIDVTIRHVGGKLYNYTADTGQVGPNLDAYDARLNSVTDSNGYVQTYVYSNDGQIEKITDSFGREVEFTYNEVIWQKFDNNGNVIEEVLEDDYDTQGNPIEVLRDPWPSTISRIDLPDGNYVTYDYDAIGDFNNHWNVYERLTEVKWYNSLNVELKRETYHYENTDFPYALTGITDDAGIRYSTWSYDEYGLAISSEHSGGVNKHTIDYDHTVSPYIHTHTDPLGLQTQYEVQANPSYKHRIERVDGLATQNCAPALSTRQYTNDTQNDFAHIVTQETDKEGNVTNYARDDWGKATTVTRAVGTTEEFTTTITRNDVFHRPTEKTEPGLTTNYVYDSVGRMTSMKLTDTSAQSAPARNWTYGYTGPHITSVDGPLTGTSDTYTFQYSGPNLTQVTNPLGQVTTINLHNPIGAPRRIIDPNGVTTLLFYDERHRLKTINRDGAITAIQYSPTDLITYIRQPNGVILTFHYDNARRLKYIQNSAGERIIFARNTADGIVNTTIRVVGGPLEYRVQTLRDELNRVMETIGVGATAGGKTRTYLDYDKEDNLTTITDNENKVWQHSFDSLNRLVSETDPLGGVTNMTRSGQQDGRNDLTAVTDPRGVTTDYTLNGYGEVIQEISLEAGTTSYLRDERGLVTSMTDGRGVVSNYSYDLLGRLLTVSYPSDPTQNITYTYDEGSYGIGQLTTVVEDFGDTTYDYNTLGHMTLMNRDIDGESYATGYGYDASGEVMSTTYPSGAVVTHTRDAAGRIDSVELAQIGLSTTMIADNITYKPFGPVESYDMGDGHSLSITYDLNYRATDFVRDKSGTSLMNIDFAYDGLGNILSMTDNIRPARTQTFAYDALSRLTSADGAYGGYDYGYNAGGDRTYRDWTDGIDSTSEDYTYDLTTYRLTSVSFTDAMMATTLKRQFGYDAGGFVTSDTRTDPATSTVNPYTYEINARGRMDEVKLSGATVAEYIYDETEQRIAKTAGGSTVHYHYDLEGRLISETDGDTGLPIRDYIWFGLTPLAVVDYSGPTPELSYLHADHLGRPQFATDTSGTVIWDMGADVTPFGEGVNTAGAFAQKLMFPGQYADTETGTDIILSHNWHRTYDPTLGRYLQSDPIDLAGGLNRYAYVGGNPNSYVDPYGLFGVAGGLIGGGLDLAIQLANNGGKLECINWTRVGLAAAGGAIGGAWWFSAGSKFGKYTRSYQAFGPRYRKWLAKNRNTPDAPYELHHQFSQAGGRFLGRVERNMPSWRNHPMFLKPLKQASHRRLTGRWGQKPRFNPFQRVWVGTPNWMLIGGGAPVAGVIADQLDCNC